MESPASSGKLGCMIKRSRKKKSYRWLWWLLPILVIVVCGVLVLLADKPPVQQLEHARTVLSDARKADAGIYSRQLFGEAEVLYDSAMRVWKRENERWIVVRDFAPVVILAERSENSARQAIEHAREVKRNLKQDLENEIAQLRQEMDGFERFFALLPLEKALKSRHAQGKLSLNEAEIAFDKGDYKQGWEKSHVAAQEIRAAYRAARQLLDGYFRQLPDWQKRLAGAVELSRRDRCWVIVVEKIPARCHLYYKGERKHSFPAEFGRNWIGDKRQEGDDATPEGRYKVVKRLSGRQTKYGKALLLDYPNAADRERLERLKKSGQLAAGTRPGGLIEIHGGGGREVNWTNGCVALDNRDMDEVYKHARKDTPVFIIGASVPWREAGGGVKLGTVSLNE